MPPRHIASVDMYHAPADRVRVVQYRACCRSGYAPSRACTCAWAHVGTCTWARAYVHVPTRPHVHVARARERPGRSRVCACVARVGYRLARVRGALGCAFSRSQRPARARAIPRATCRSPRAPRAPRRAAPRARTRTRKPPGEAPRYSVFWNRPRARAPRALEGVSSSPSRGPARARGMRYC